MAKRILWSREELIITLSLYFQLPFGRLNHGTPEVKQLAELLGRTNNSVALRLVNFAACDPYILATGRHGMASGASVCKPIWDEFACNREQLFIEAERIKADLLKQSIDQILNITEADLVGTTREAVVKMRVNQNVFRSMVLSNYNTTCAITGISVPELLVASHIVPWAQNEKERLNPENGICLSSLYDRAFDQGLISISSDYCILLSDKLKEYAKCDFYGKNFASIENQKILLPEEHLPKKLFLEWHRDMVFNKQV